MSLASEELIDVSAQYKLAILLSPRTTLLLPAPIAPLGEPDLPASIPKHKLLSPDVTSSPAALPTAVLFPPVVSFKASRPQAVLLLPSPQVVKAK